MFDFLFQDSTGKLISLTDFIKAKIDTLNASSFAFEKAVRMIGKAVAKSEIILQDENGTMLHDEKYFRLNIQPNDNETGTDFWFKVVCYLLVRGECVIVRIDDKYYIADTWECTDSVLKPKKYSNIVLTSAGELFPIRKTFIADDIVHIRYYNEKIMTYYKSIVSQYDETINAINASVKMKSAAKFGLKMETNITIKDRETGKPITQDGYTQKMLDMLTSESPAVIPLGNGVNLEQIAIESPVAAADIFSMVAGINKTCAMAFDIPLAVFNGEITEKSDATNEFITFAVGPVVEVINDSLNAKYVGMEDYVKGQRITIWLGNFKHADLLDSASQLEKLRGIGFNFDELRNAVGYVPLNSDFSKERALTKNIGTTEGETK